MKPHLQANTVQRCGERSTSPSPLFLLALLLVAWGAGCDRVTPSEPEAQDASRVPSGEVAASDARDTTSESPASAPGKAPDAGLPAAAADVPAPTIAKSSAEATRKGDATATLRAVRTGEHSRSDRLAFEFDGSGLPAWQVEYVDKPLRDCGSGEPVPVAGDAWLQIQFIGARGHTDAGEPTSGPRRRTVNQTVIRELVRTCDFEGHMTWVVGVASPNSYTPQVMVAPSRLVVDIAH